MNAISEVIRFELPNHLACPEPTEVRKIARDDVRLLVTRGHGEIKHTRFKKLAEYLNPGDVLVVNTSATIPAAFPVNLPGNGRGRVHFSTKPGPAGWLVEIREVKNNKTIRWKGGEENMEFSLPGNAVLRLKSQFYEDRNLLNLWKAELEADLDAHTYMTRFGRPVKYMGLDKPYPLDYYQTIFSFHPGSSEMPSAGRGFTPSLVDRLLQKGIHFAPVLLHTGVSSLEENEAPYPEYMEIDPLSAAIINRAKENGGKVIAVGTTSVRALESAVDHSGKVLPYKGKTNLYIRHGHKMKIIDGLLTGFHEPKASHLNMLQSLAGYEHIEQAYSEAIRHGYYWHQFGDLHLLMN